MKKQKQGRLLCALCLALLLIPLAGMLLVMLPAATAALLAVPAVVFFAVAAAATILFVRLIADACTMSFAEYA